jgi:hypothetical protein
MHHLAPLSELRTLTSVILKTAIPTKRSLVIRCALRQQLANTSYSAMLKPC